MKKLIFAGVAALMLAVTGCKSEANQNPELVQLQDSVSMDFGKIFAGQYNAQVQYMPDSLKYNKAEVLKGLKVAIEADNSVNGQSYMMGLQMGLAIAQNVSAIEDQFGLKLDKKLILAALAQELSKDTIAIDINKIGAGIDEKLMKAKKIMVESDTAAQANKKKTEAFLADLVKNGAKEVNGIVCKTIEEGTGNTILASDELNVVYTMSTLKGDVLASSRGQAQKLSAGYFANLNKAMVDAVTSVRHGGHYEFYFNIGAEVATGGVVKPYDVVKVEIQFVPAEEPAEAK